ncbi:MAG: transcription antitermination factor NusB [Gammaproteobacteria bacterium]|nr:transcription antitermination factor NusB [Gammaproteobacteria bacterium]
MSRARSLARQRALQALYQWELTGQSLGDIEKQFMEIDVDREEDDPQMKGVESGYFSELLHGIPAMLTELDALTAPLLDRPIAQLDPIERVILRIGSFELKQRIDIPYRVVINESVELAKLFGAEQGHKYVNGILDKLSQSLRATEIKAAASRPRR